jgi:hypothetical protein
LSVASAAPIKEAPVAVVCLTVLDIGFTPLPRLIARRGSNLLRIGSQRRDASHMQRRDLGHISHFQENPAAQAGARDRLALPNVSISTLSDPRPLHRMCAQGRKVGHGPTVLTPTFGRRCGAPHRIFPRGAAH